MSLPKSQKIEFSNSPLALIVGESGITHSLSQKLREGGCEVVELNDYPKSGKFNYIFQFGTVAEVKDSHLKFLKPSGKFMFIDYLDEDISGIKNLEGIKILRVENLNTWYFRKLLEEILKITFTSQSKNIIDLRFKGKVFPNVKKSVRLSDDSVPVVSQNLQRDIKSLPSKYIRRNISPVLLWFLFAVFLILILLTSFIFYQVFSVRQILNNAKIHYASSDITRLNQDISELKLKINFAGTVYENTNYPLNPFSGSEMYKNTGLFISTASEFLVSLENSLDLLLSIKNDNHALTVKDMHISEERYQQVIDSLNILLTGSRQLQSAAKRLDIPLLSPDSQSEFLDLTVNILDSLMTVLPPFKKVFYNGERQYLLLFQNNMELRPTGGFIGSLGFLTLNNGRMQALDLMDVYTVDGQLKGHVDPPDPIRKYFNQPNWFLRDSNFDPDFAVSSLQAEWFLDKSLSKKVDGVIGLNLFLVADLLSLTGPLTLPDFNNEVITSDNLFIKSQLYINRQFFAGSTQKKDFLKSLTGSLMKKLADEKISYVKLIAFIKKSLQEKNLQFYFNDGNLQKEFENLGWTGRVYDIRCLNTDVSCLPDYLFVNEANFGVNKANFFITKSLEINKRFNSNGQLITDLTVNYHNQSQPGILQGGQYTNYLRLFLPKKSVLIKAEFKGVKIDPQSFDVTDYADDKTVYGYLLKIPENSAAVFNFSYLLPDIISQNHHAYQFYLQKQSGDKTASVSISFDSRGKKLSPENFIPLKDTEGVLKYQTDSSVDRIFQISLSP